MEYQIDFGTHGIGQRPANEGPLYASVPGRASALGNGEVVFYDTEAGSTHVMTEQVLQALDLARPFQTLDQHVERIVAAIPALKGQGQAVRRVLSGLVQRGLLVDDAGFTARFAETPAVEQAPLAGVFIRACDRPHQLRALLETLLEYERRHAPRLRYVVVDDSAEAAAVAEHARLLGEFGSEAGVPTLHVDAARVDGIVQALCGELPEHAGELRAMLERDPAYAGRRGGGTGKNLITLLAAGGRYVLLDDDFLFPLRRHPDHGEGLRFDAGAWATRTFAGLDQALAAGGELEFDPLARQLELCGQSLGAIANRVEGCALGRDQLRGIPPSRTPQLSPARRVVATVNGHRGDAGASGAGWMYVLDPAARAGMTASRADYMAALERPAVWHGARAWQVVRHANFTPFCVDNSRLMPCTSPFGRSEDALFAALSSALWDDTVIVHTPFAVGHRQEGVRGRHAALQRAETPDVNLCLAEFARHVGADLRATGPERRTTAVAALLDDLAGDDDAGLTAYLGEYLAYLRGSLIEALQQSLHAAKEPPIYWAADLRGLVEANGRALVGQGVPRFAGWREDLDASGCAAAFRHEAGTLAAGLRAWPDAWQVALASRERWLGG